MQQLNARGIRTLDDLSRSRSIEAALRTLEARSVAVLRRALARSGGPRGRDQPRRGPALDKAEPPREVRDAIANAKRASERWNAARLARERGPIPELERAREAPRLKAMLAMADATIKAFRGGQPWATAERVRQELDAYARAVSDLIGPDE